MPPKILYVEDNPQNLRLVKKLLSKTDYILLEAIDGRTGLNMVISQQPDLILMDVNLPDIDGTEVTSRIKGDPQFNRIPIIALTADNRFSSRTYRMQWGYDGYLGKPITRTELIDIIESFLPKPTDFSESSLREETDPTLNTRDSNSQ
jgi:CheY-like chemotaxis protein